MTRPRLLLCSLFALIASPNLPAAEKDARLYELRTYHAPSGKLDALHARFRDHTLKLFEKHGITNVGYWVPIENPDNKLIYLVSFPDSKAREKSFKDFLADPDWQKAHRESEANGKLVDKIESQFFSVADYSPAIKPEKKGDRVFEMRTYTATAGNLDRLHNRFRQHTTKLFERHGMSNIAYFTVPKDQPSADNTLLYFIAHKTRDAAKASFDAFRKDPDWIAARTASEKAGGGSLTTPDGVKSLFLKPTDYSPWQ